MRNNKELFYHWLFVVWLIVYLIVIVLLRWSNGLLYLALSRPIVSGGILALLLYIIVVVNLKIAEKRSGRLPDIWIKPLSEKGRYWLKKSLPAIGLLSLAMLSPDAQPRLRFLWIFWLGFPLTLSLYIMVTHPRPAIKKEKEEPEKEAPPYIDPIKLLMQQKSYRGQRVYEEVIQEFEGDAVPTYQWPEVLRNTPIYQICEERDDVLYRHQLNALLEFENGNDVLILTPIGSGKSTAATFISLNWVLKGNGNAVFVLPDDESVDIRYRKILNGLNERKQFGIVVYRRNRRHSDYTIVGVNKGKQVNDLLSPDIVVISADMLREEIKSFIRSPEAIRFLTIGTPLIVVDELFAFPTPMLTGLSLLFRYFNWRYNSKFESSPRYLLTSSTEFENAEELAKKLTGKSGISVIKGDFSPVKKKTFHIWLPPMEIAMGQLGSTSVRLKRKNYVEEIKQLAGTLMALGENVMIIASGVPFSTHQKFEIERDVKDIAFSISQKSQEQKDIHIGSVKIASSIYEISEEQYSSVTSFVVTGFHPYYYNILEELRHLGDKAQEENHKSINIFVVPSEHPTDQFSMKTLRKQAYSPEFRPRMLLNDNDIEYLEKFLFHHIPEGGEEEDFFNNFISDPGIRKKLIRDGRKFRKECNRKNDYKCYYKPIFESETSQTEVFMWDRGRDTYKVVLSNDPSKILQFVESDRVQNIAMTGFILRVANKLYSVVTIDHEKRTVFVEETDREKITYKFSKLEKIEVREKEEKIPIQSITSGRNSVSFSIMELRNIVVNEKIMGFKEYPLGINLGDITHVRLKKPIKRRINVENAFAVMFEPSKIIKKFKKIAENLKKETGDSRWLDVVPENEELSGESYRKVLHVILHAFLSAVKMMYPKDFDKIEIHIADIDIGKGPRKGILFFDASRGLGFARLLKKSVPQLVELAYSILTSCPCATGCPICLGNYRCPEEHDFYPPEWEVDRTLKDGHYKEVIQDSSSFDKLNAILVLGSAVGKMDEALEKKYIRLVGINNKAYMLKLSDEIKDVLKRRFVFTLQNEECGLAIPRGQEPTIELYKPQNEGDLGYYEPDKNRIVLSIRLREEEWHFVFAHEYFHAVELKGNIANCNLEEEFSTFVGGQGIFTRFEGLKLITQYLSNFKPVNQLIKSKSNFLYSLFAFEGFAQWGAYKIAEYYGLTYQLTSEKLWTDQEFVRKSIDKEDGQIKRNKNFEKLLNFMYMGGFMFFLYLDRELGFNETMKFVVTGKLNGSELEKDEFEDLLYKSKARDILI